MKRRLPFLCVCAALALAPRASAQLTLENQVLANPDNEPAPVHPVPSPRQLLWNETEFYGFFHFGMNTFTGLEWGNGNESETTFAPTQVPNPEQWLTACKKAGMKGGIAVVKHHDGFCLWPTATTSHCVSSSSNYGKQTNIPETFAAAAKELEMKYGFYVSPWDRNSSYYGTQDYIDKVFIPQCEELAAYGEDQFEMWFDGANGGSGYYGGKNTTVSVDRYVYYDVPNLRYKVHSLADNCVMWGVGGEARWIGNESGYAGETNWATHPWKENQSTCGTGVEDYWLWNAGESDAKATSGGWFWHSGETVTSAETLFKMYLETVGRNSTFILNFPPNQAGVLPDEDVEVLTSLGEMMEKRLGTDLALNSTVTADYTRTAGTSRTYDASNLVDGDKDTYWATDDAQTTASLTFDLGSTKSLHYVLLQEYIKKGQRVKGFNIQYSTDGSSWTTAAQNIAQTTIGYKRIIPLNGSTSSSYSTAVNARYIKVNITSSKACPLLHTVSIY
jgi:alpha-L-fucosidase